MNALRFLAACALSVTAGALSASAAVATPPQRQVSVDLAERLTRPSAPVLPPGELKSPFSPPDFDRPAADENKGGPKDKPQPDKPSGPSSDREIVEALAARIPNAATIGVGGRTLLVIGKTRLQVGDSFTVNNPLNNQDYELELVAVSSTTFTLRYRGEDVTRPIKSAK